MNQKTASAPKNADEATLKRYETMNTIFKEKVNGKQYTGVGFILFNGIDLPSYLSEFGGSILLFYGGVVYVFSTLFRSIMVPLTNEIYITDAPLTEKILNICQAIFIHRFRR